jgi:hypothetical protein
VLAVGRLPRCFVWLPDAVEFAASARTTTQGKSTRFHRACAIAVCLLMPNSVAILPGYMPVKSRCGCKSEAG